MSRDRIIEELKQYFNVAELVCKHTYNKWKDNSWQFVDTELLHTLLILRRDILKVPLVCNNWKAGGKYTQRGIRCNLCQQVKDKTNSNTLYLSSHCMGKGVDLSSGKMAASRMRELIKENSDLLPYPVRIEKDVNWLHIDVYDVCSGSKVTEFKG